MSDDRDFTAPCAATNAAGARCLLEAHFLDDVEQPHEHEFPPSIADQLRKLATHPALREVAVLTEAADWLDQSDEILRAHATALPSMVAELHTLREQVTIADLDGTDDAATWLTPGHVLDVHEVQYLRGLRVPR